MIRRQRMDTYALVVGEPWTVNGHEIEATESQSALQVIFEDARRLPAYVDVTTIGGKTFHLIMDADGSTRPADQEEPARDQKQPVAAAAPVPEPDPAPESEPAHEADPEPLSASEPAADAAEEAPAASETDPLETEEAQEVSAPAQENEASGEAADTDSKPAAEGERDQTAAQPGDAGSGEAPQDDAQPRGGSTAIAMGGDGDEAAAGSAGTLEDELLSEQEEDPESVPEQRAAWRRPLVIGGVAAGLLAIATVGAFGLMSRDGQPDSTAAQPSEAAEAEESAEEVSLPGNGDVAGLTDRVAVVLEGDEIRLLDPATAEQIGEGIHTEDTEGVRVVSTEGIDVIDTGDGAFLTYDGESEPQRFDGQISVRGTVPVAVEGDHYRTVQNPDEQQDTPEGAAVFGATENGVALAEAPRSVTIGDHDVELSPPHEGAEPTSWVQVSEDHIVILWPGEDDGDPETLAIHSAETGEITDESDASKDEVVVRNGTTQIGDDKYITDGEIADVCDGGEFLNGYMLCPAEGDSWESETGKADSKPIAISDSHFVTADHQIHPLQ